VQHDFFCTAATPSDENGPPSDENGTPSSENGTPSSENGTPSSENGQRNFAVRNARMKFFLNVGSNHFFTPTRAARIGLYPPLMVAAGLR